MHLRMRMMHGVEKQILNSSNSKNFKLNYRRSALEGPGYPAALLRGVSLPERKTKNILYAQIMYSLKITAIDINTQIVLNI